MPDGAPKKIPITSEYLVLVVLAVVFGIAGFFVMEGFSSVSYKIGERDVMAYWAEAKIGILRYYSSPQGTYISMRNNEPFVVQITRISLNDVTVNVNFRAMTTGESVSLVHPANCTKGDYAYKTTIYYVDVEHNMQRQFTGTVPLAGTCQA
jgi:hypothetical protein